MPSSFANLDKTVAILNLGCARNLVDSQTIITRFLKKGYRLVDGNQAEVAVINTCGFIEDAKKESLDAIIDLISLKRQGKIKKLIVAGCLSERYSRELKKEFKAIDAIIGVQKISDDNPAPKVLLTPKHYAYVKICESCYHKCSFCAIPKIKGKFASRGIASIEKEVKFLDANGVKEINVIGQDISAYGIDLYGEKSLVRLLKALIPAAKNIQWIRLLYNYPSHITDELLDLIAGEDKICKYLDIPLQHVNDRILKAMNRGHAKADIEKLISKIRKKIPGAALRTTFIVGFPGETEREFKELMDFVKQMRFDRLGAFIFSPEEGTRAYKMPRQIPPRIKQSRYECLMKLQQDISREKLERFIGRKLRVIIDEKERGADNVYTARSEFDAPEVDGTVQVKSAKKLKIGGLINVKIKAAYEYDLIAEAI